MSARICRTRRLGAASCTKNVIKALFIWNCGPKNSRVVGLPREMIVVKAALFRLLRSNKLKGTALQKMALAIKQGSTNGEADDAIKAVVTDQNRTDAFFQKVALVHPDNLEDLLKEEE